jgi:hypothetical protein
VEDLRRALEDLGISDATISLTVRGMPKYRSLWLPYKQWCTDHNRLVLSCTTREAFCHRTAAAQLADFLAYMSAQDNVKVVGTLGNYRSCINKFFVVVFECDPLTDSPRVKMVIDGFGKDHPSQPRWASDETWDPGCIVAYWADQPDNDDLSIFELAHKSFTLFATACWPRCSDAARVVRSSITFDPGGDMLFVYKGTKGLRLPILGPQLGVSANSVAPKICVARTMRAYLERTKHLQHNDRVWCCTRPVKGQYTSVCENGDTLRHWMRRIMTRCGVDPKFTGGSIRQAASSKAIDEGWEVAAVLKMGMWKSFATWNRFYNRSRLSMAPGPTFHAAG